MVQKKITDPKKFIQKKIRVEKHQVESVLKEFAKYPDVLKDRDITNDKKRLTRLRYWYIREDTISTSGNNNKPFFDEHSFPEITVEQVLGPNHESVQRRK